MTEKKLLEYGMEFVGNFQIVDGNFIMPIKDHDLIYKTHCIYAFLINDHIVRVGVTEKPLRKRMREWEIHVTHALAGRPSKTPRNEAVGWEKDLQDFGFGKFFARVGTVVETPIGLINICKSEESELIARHKPKFCNDIKRHFVQIELN